MDAFSVVIESGYFLEEADFYELLDILQVNARCDHAVERAKVLEFFTEAAELLGFDAKAVSATLTEPWELEAADYNAAIESQGFMLKGRGSSPDGQTVEIDKTMIR